MNIKKKIKEIDEMISKFTLEELKDYCETLEYGGIPGLPKELRIKYTKKLGKTQEEETKNNPVSDTDSKLIFYPDMEYINKVNLWRDSLYK